MGHAIRTEDCYAAHVSEATKLDALRRDLEDADKIERGEVSSLSVWQQVNTGADRRVRGASSQMVR